MSNVSRRLFTRIALMLSFWGMLALAVAPLTAQSAPRGAKSVVVPSNVPWTNTLLTVRRGQWLRFEPTGEIRLSFDRDDTSLPAGSRGNRRSERAAFPAIPLGALIGKVNSGQPFSIAAATQAFQMPANGTLFLGVNDDHVQDNSGNYVVKVWEP
jgi:hypothetical protein